MFMIEKVINRKGERVIEVRSDAGRLLLIKTKQGYELKCPRTKQICLIRYEVMLSDCLRCMDKIPDDAGIKDKIRRNINYNKSEAGES